MFRSTFIAALAASCLAAICAAPAGAADPRQPYPNPTQPFTLAGYCAFPVQVDYTRSNEYIIHRSTAPDGTITQQITGYAAINVTNETTGKSLTYHANGPGTVVTYPDGAFSVNSHGPSLFWTTPQDSYPGVPPISYTTGNVSFSVDPSGLTTSYNLDGSQTDVCQALAG